MNNNWNNDHEFYNDIKDAISNQVRAKNPLFNVPNINDSTIPFTKLLYWKYPKKRFETDIFSEFKSFFKILLQIFKKNKPTVRLISRGRNTSKIDFFIQIFSDAQFDFYKPLIDKLSERFKVGIFSAKVKKNHYQQLMELHGRLDQENIPFLYYDNIKLSHSLNEKLILIKQLFKIGKWQFLLKSFEERKSVYIDTIIYEKVALKKIKGLILSVGENSSYGFVASNTGKKHDFLVINTQNGWRGRMAINNDSSFSAWFMHDSLMKEVLKRPSIPQSQLIITGTLFTDHVYNFLTRKTKIERNYLTIFSSPLYKKEQYDLAKYIVAIGKKEDFHVKIHPSEKRSENVFQKMGFKLYEPNQNLNSIEQLIELILSSKICITFASFVSYQCKLLNISVINIEYRKKSILNYIKPLNIHHINDCSELENYLLNIDVKKQEKFITKNICVANKMVKEIIKLENSHKTV